MGSCSNSKYANRDSWNPITDLLRLYTLEELTKQWDQFENDKLVKRYESNQDDQIKYEEFLRLFPKLAQYSNETKHRFHKLFGFEKNNQITMKNIIVGITIIQQVDDPLFISEVVYFVYLTQDYISKNKQDKKKFLLKAKGYQKFVHENENKLILLSSVTQKDLKHKIDTSTDITLEEFQEIFQKYRYDLFIQLFNSTRIEKKQTQLMEQISSQKTYIMKSGTIVNLIEFQWFYQWYQICQSRKVYIEDKYNIYTKYQEEIDQKNKKKGVSVNFKTSKSKIMDNKQRNQGPEFSRPSRVKNLALFGEESGELRQNLRQFKDYVIVPRQLWEKIVDVYGGSPAIQRKFPQIHTIQLNLVQVNQFGKFLYSDINIHHHTYRSSKVRHIFQKQKYLKYKRCFYKTPGLQNWEQIINLQITIGELTKSAIVFMCLILNDAVDSFLDLYNHKQKDGKKYIQKRIKNYASVINVPVDGVLLKGIVTKINDNFIEVTYKNDSENFIKTKFREKKLKALNPSVIQTQKKLNFLSGMTNYSNNCYMNSIIQCLIRTPSFEKYLSSMVYMEKKKTQSVTSTLFKIIDQSKKKEVIEIQKFKAAMQKQSRIFIGSDQQDAQQFLIALLEQLSQEAKKIQNQQIQYGFRKNVDSTAQRQKKIARFFSGMSYGETECVKCHNKNEVRSPFFTYTLNLPQHEQFQMDYIIVPFEKKPNWQITKCAMTITVKTTIKQMMNTIANVHEKKKQNLIFFCFNEGQLYQNLGTEPSDQPVKHYHSFGFKVIVYEIDLEIYPKYIQLRSRYELKKIKNFKQISYPLVIPVKQKMRWQQIQKQVHKIFMNKYEEEQDSDSQQQMNLNQSSKNKLSSSQNKIKEQKKKEEHSLPYKIRILLKENSKCFFCNKKIPFDNHMNFGIGFCKGCKLSQNNSISFEKYCLSSRRAIVIVAEWDGHDILKQLPFINHKSLSQSKENAKKRIDHLQIIFKQNFQNSQLLELNCSKQNCSSKEAIRRQGIKEYPNILLIHLNRFRYKDGELVKMNNSVKYPQALVLNHITYDLFATVVHVGSCTSGHYYCYVYCEKLWFCCNDEFVRRAQINQYINSYAYVLFYKRRDFEPGIASLSL